MAWASAAAVSWSTSASPRSSTVTAMQAWGSGLAQRSASCGQTIEQASSKGSPPERSASSAARASPCSGQQLGLRPAAGRGVAVQQRFAVAVQVEHDVGVDRQRKQRLAQAVQQRWVRAGRPRRRAARRARGHTSTGPEMAGAAPAPRCR
jgi:hypothetical protein